MSETLLTRSEAQNILRVSKSTMFRLIHDGKIPSVQVGCTYRIRRSDLDTFLKTNAEKGGERNDS